MATLTFDGLDDVISKLTKLGERLDPTVKAMLHAGGLAAKEELQTVLETSHRHILTGSMHDKTGYSNPRGSGAEQSTVVYPRGKDKKGTPNALKGFVLNYGTRDGRIIGDNWFFGGFEAAEPRIESEMRRVFEEAYDDIMED